MNKHLHIFQPPAAVLAIRRQASGTRFNANAMFSGENRDGGAMLSFIFNPPKNKQGDKSESRKREGKGRGKSDDQPKKDKVKVEILNVKNDVIRTLQVEADPGFNRTTWGLRRKGVRSTGGRGWGGQMRQDREPPGPPVLPGSYTVRISHAKDTVSQVVNVITDPRVDIYSRNLEELQPLYDRQMELAELTGKALKQLREAKETIGSVNKLLNPKQDKDHKELKTLGKEAQEKIDELEKLIVNPRGRQGISRNPKVLSTQVGMLNRYLYSNTTGRNDTHNILLKHAEKETEKVLDQVNSFFDKEWEDYENAVESARLSPFKNYEPLKVKQ